MKYNLLKTWLTGSVGRKIGSLFVLAVCGILLILVVGTGLFDRLYNTVTSMSTAGTLYRTLYFQSASAYESFKNTGAPSFIKEFKQCNAIMQSVDGVMGDIFALHAQGLSEDGVVAAFQKKHPGSDPAAILGSLGMIDMLEGPVQGFYDGKGLLKRLVDNSEAAHEVTVALNGLFDRYVAVSSAEEKAGLDVQIQEMIRKMDGTTDATMQRFTELGQNLAAPIKPIFVAVSAATMVILALLSFFITRSITFPLKQTMDFAEKIRRGHLEHTLSISNRDELGRMTESLNEMTQSLSDMILDMKTGILELGASSGQLFDISENLNDLSVTTSGSTKEASQSVSRVTQDMKSTVTAIEASSHNINLVSSATEEMSATINEIALNAEKAREVSSDAVVKAGSASEKMAALDQATKSIGQITETIADISEQTNLLALNATIEAARAGEAGKGFSVVANEIKELASQTAGATADINRQILSVQDSTHTAISEITQVTSVIDNINDIVSSIASAVEQQSAVTREIAGNIERIVFGVNDMNTTVSEGSDFLEQVTSQIRDVTCSAGNVADSSRKVKESAGTMAALSEDLRGLIKRFSVKER